MICLYGQIIVFPVGDFVSGRQNGYIYYDYHKKTEAQEIAVTAWSSVFHWVSGIVAVLSVIFFFIMFFFRPVTVDGPSMEPTLHSGDRLFVYSFAYTPKQGDIVVIGTPDSSLEPIIKRIIATENQTVDVDYEKGIVYVDGVPLEEDYISGMSEKPVNELEYPYTVPEGHVFVMGDYRDESRDSRYKTVAAIDEDRIAGKAIVRFFPFADFMIID